MSQVEVEQGTSVAETETSPDIVPGQELASENHPQSSEEATHEPIVETIVVDAEPEGQECGALQETSQQDCAGNISNDVALGDEPSPAKEAIVSPKKSDPSPAKLDDSSPQEDEPQLEQKEDRPPAEEVSAEVEGNTSKVAAATEEEILAPVQAHIEPTEEEHHLSKELKSSKDGHPEDEVPRESSKRSSKNSPGKEADPVNNPGSEMIQEGLSAEDSHLSKTCPAKLLGLDFSLKDVEEPEEPVSKKVTKERISPSKKIEEGILSEQEAQMISLEDAEQPLKTDSKDLKKVKENHNSSPREVTN